jgi:hypothetical protein
MSIQAVLLPLFVEVLLTFVLGFWATTVRFSDVRGGDVKPRDVSLREPNWSRRTLQITYAYESQLELPVLFYVLTILAWLTHNADYLFILLAWVFVVLRLGHAYVHVTSNHLGQRAALFIAGAIVLTVMWAIFMLRILLVL